MKFKFGKISLVLVAALMLLACGGGGGGGGGSATPTPTPTPTATPTPTPAPATHVTINSVDNSDCTAAVAYVTVTDEYDELVMGLTDDNFTVRVDGNVTTIAGFEFIENANTPVSVSLVMDYSRSTEDILNAMKEGAISFIQGMDNDDEGEIIRFAGNSETTQLFTTVKSDLIDAINSTFPDATNTDIFTPLMTRAIPDASAPGRTGRGAILLFTDGFHNYTVYDDYTPDQVIAEANANGIPIFVIGYMFARTDDRIESDRDTLERLAQETGGVYLEAPDADSFADLYQQIADLIQNQYQITFNGSGGASLEITVNRGGVTGVSEAYDLNCDF